MAGKNVGITLIGVVVAVGAFVASNIWATSLRDKVERLNHATDAWSGADMAVGSNEIDLNRNGPADLLGITARLKHRIADTHQLEDATLKLMQAGTGTLKEEEISIKHGGPARHRAAVSQRCFTRPGGDAG